MLYKVHKNKLSSIETFLLNSFRNPQHYHFPLLLPWIQRKTHGLGVSVGPGEHTQAGQGVGRNPEKLGKEAEAFCLIYFIFFHAVFVLPRTVTGSSQKLNVRFKDGI